MGKIREGLLGLLIVLFALTATALGVSNVYSEARTETMKSTAATAEEFLSATDSLTTSSDAEIVLAENVTLSESVALKGKVKIRSEEKKTITLTAAAFFDVKNGADITFDNISVLQEADSTAKYALLFRENTRQGRICFYGCDFTTKRTTVPLLKAVSNDGNFYVDDTILSGGNYSLENGNLMISGKSTYENVSANTMVYDFRSATIAETVTDNRVYFSVENKPVYFKGATPDDKARFDTDIYYTLDGSIPAISDTRIRYDGSSSVSLIVDRQIKVSLVGRGIIYECGFRRFDHEVNADKTPSALKEVSAMADRSYRCGTKVTAKDMPEAVKIVLEDGRTIYALADWDLSTLDLRKEGDYTVYAALTLPYFVTDEKNQKAEMKISVYYEDIEEFALDLADPMQETKNTAEKGYVVGTFSCKGGDEENYTYTLIPVGDSEYFIVEDDQLKLAQRMTNGGYEITVRVESADKTAETTFRLSVAEKSYKKIVCANPYASIDWDSVDFIETSPHNHTFYSSGLFEESEHNDNASDTVAERLARYRAFGYGAVIFTEHDYVTLDKIGGTYAGIDDTMLYLYGNEMSKAHDMLYYGLVPYYDMKGQGVKNTNGVIGNLNNIRALNGKGISYFPHPNRIDTDKDYWLNLFNEYRDVVYGMEVFNAGQAQRNYSESLWDYILSATMPERAIWGSASDDAHSSGSVGTGWLVLLLKDDEMNMEGVFNALKSGNSFLSTVCVDPLTDEDRMRDDVNEADIPYFTSIKVNEEKGTITATAEHYTTIDWVSENGKVVATGATLDLNRTYGVNKYVRCRIYGAGGMSHSQPIGIKDGTEIYELPVEPVTPPASSDSGNGGASMPDSSSDGSSETSIQTSGKKGCGSFILSFPHLLLAIVAGVVARKKDMKNKIVKKRICALALCIAAAVSLCSCKSPSNEVFDCTGRAIRLYVGQEGTFENDTYSYFSDNRDVVETDGNTYKCVGAGSAVITAKDSVGHTTAVFLVAAFGNAPVPLTGLEIENQPQGVTVGQSVQLEYSKYPSNADNYDAILWSSDDPETLSVDKTGKVTALKPGAATITLTAHGTDVTKQINISAIPRDTVFRLNYSAIIGVEGSEEKVLNPDILCDYGLKGDPEWFSSDGSIAVVDENGKTAFLQEGKTNIGLRAETTAGDKLEARCSVTVVKDEGFVVLRTPEQLQAIGNVSGNYMLGNDVDMKTACAVGGALYDSGKGFMPLFETARTPFKGIFDGNGFAIENMVINRPNDVFVAFMRYISCEEGNEGMIRGLAFRNAEICGGNYTSVFYANSTGFGSSAAGLLNCYAEGNISSVGSLSCLVGNNKGLLKNCIAEFTFDALGNAYLFALNHTSGGDGVGAENCVFIGESGGTPFANLTNGGFVRNCAGIKKSEVAGYDFALGDGWDYPVGQTPTIGRR